MPEGSDSSTSPDSPPPAVTEPDPGFRHLLTDLRDEGENLDRMITSADPAAWQRPTPADGWTIAHQIAHLAATDEDLLLALDNPDEFRSRFSRDPARNDGGARVDVDARVDGGARVDVDAAAGLVDGKQRTMDRWRASRSDVLARAARLDPKTRLPWHGPPMSLRTAITARLMETWAHGQDVADALGIGRTPQDSIRHIVTLAVLARDYAFQVNGLTPPDTPFLVRLLGPSGQTWIWGPEDAPESVEGSAADFALLAVRRRHRDNCRVTAHGQQAETWLNIVQAYAGPPGPGRTSINLSSPDASAR